MANKKAFKVQFDTDSFRSIMKSQGKSIRSLDTDASFDGSAKTVERALRSGEITPTMLHILATYLGVHIYLLIKPEAKKMTFDMEDEYLEPLWWLPISR